MKKIFLFTLLLSAVCMAQQANARKGIPIGALYGSSEKIDKVADFPDNDSFKVADGKYIDLGVKYTVFTLFFVPVYTEKEPVLVGYQDDKTYYDIPQEQLNQLLTTYKLDRTKLEKLSFWNAFGGKIVFVLIIIIIIWGLLPSKKKKEEVKPQTL